MTTWNVSRAMYSKFIVGLEEAGSRDGTAARVGEDLLEEHVEPSLTDGQPALRHGGAFVLAGCCWCQQGTALPPPAQPLSGLLQGMARLWAHVGGSAPGGVGRRGVRRGRPRERPRRDCSWRSIDAASAVFARTPIDRVRVELGTAVPRAHIGMRTPMEVLGEGPEEAQHSAQGMNTRASGSNRAKASQIAARERHARAPRMGSTFARKRRLYASLRARHPMCMRRFCAPAQHTHARHAHSRDRSHARTGRPRCARAARAPRERAAHPTHAPRIHPTLTSGASAHSP